MSKSIVVPLAVFEPVAEMIRNGAVDAPGESPRKSPEIESNCPVFLLQLAKQA